MKLLKFLLIISLLTVAYGCTSQPHYNNMHLAQRYVDDNFICHINHDDFVLFTFYEKGICKPCYRIPLDSVYVAVCRQYANRPLYVITDSDTTISRLSLYRFQHVYYIIDTHRVHDRYGINKETPEIMIFEDKKIKEIYLTDRK